MFRHKFSGFVSALAKITRLTFVVNTRWAFSLLDLEIAALFLPIFRESFTQFGKRYVFGFATIEDQIDDVRSKLDRPIQ